MNQDNRISESSHRGYTLIEVLLVITILAGIGFVLLIQTPLKLQDRNLEIATTQMVQVIRDTRQRALAQNHQYKVVFFENDREYSVYRTNALRTITLPEKVSFYNDPSNLVFNGIGGVGGAGEVILRSGKKGNAIIITPVTARVRVEKRTFK